MTTQSLPGSIYWKPNLKHFPPFLTFQNTSWIKLETGIKNVQSDRGSKYRVSIDFLKTNGIHYRISCPWTQQQNGMVERKHGHIVETGLTLLAQASMPLKYWDETFWTFAYKINRLPTHTRNWINFLWKVVQYVSSVWQPKSIWLCLLS